MMQNQLAVTSGNSTSKANSPLDIQVSEPQSYNLHSFKKTLSICESLMQTSHYSKLGREGIFAIVSKATSLNIDPMDALNGALYFVQGKVEMTSQMMNQLIRQAGHSVQKDHRSNNSVCILHGKRADNGDEWTESFSIDEARLAGIYKENGPWGKYPRDMLFARALSRLARQLFPDVIKGCYVEGEIQANFNAIPEGKEPSPYRTSKTISKEEADELESLLDKIPLFKVRAMSFLQERFGINSLSGMNRITYNRVKAGALEKIAELDKQAESEKDNLVEISGEKND